jgi:hypothetical protein
MASPLISAAVAGAEAGVGEGVGAAAARVGCGAGAGAMVAVATGITGGASVLQPASAKVEAAASASDRVSEADDFRAGDRASGVRLIMGPFSSADSFSWALRPESQRL